MVALPTTAIFNDHYYKDSDEAKEKEENQDKDQTKRTNGDDKHQDTTLTEDADTNFGPDRHHKMDLGLGYYVNSVLKIMETRATMMENQKCYFTYCWRFENDL